MIKSGFSTENIHLADAPSIPGLVLRHFRGASDFPGMVAALNASDAADGVERVATVEGLANNYAHLVNCDLAKDLMILEVDGEVVGYVRVEWWRNDAGQRIYTPNAFLHPAWRRRGIGTAMLKWAQNRLREIAAGHPADGARYFESFISDSAPGAEALLQNDGYQPVR